MMHDAKTLDSSARSDPAIPAVLPGLDGVRAISILLVMASHSGLAHLIPGVFGVTLFFFISGFLITTLMIAEHRAHGRIGLGAFYMRRMIRLYPPLIVSIAATVVVMLAFGATISPLGVAGALAYLANYLSIFRPDLMAGLGGQLWSLAVEEHFYFVYPLLMLALLPRPKLAVPVLLALCALSLAVRLYVSSAYPAIAVDYTGKATETRLDSILYGAIAALLWWSAQGRRVLEVAIRPPVLLVALGVILFSLLWRDEVFRQTWRYSLQGLALVPLMVAATVSGTQPWVTAVLESAPMRWIGRLSYSLYLWHILAFDIGLRLIPGGGARFVAAMLLGWALTFALSMACYRYVEQPFFALRKRFGSNVQKVAQAKAA